MFHYGNWVGPGWSAGKKQDSVIDVEIPAKDAFDLSAKIHDAHYANKGNLKEADLRFAKDNIGKGFIRTIAGLAVGTQGMFRGNNNSGRKRKGAPDHRGLPPGTVTGHTRGGKRFRAESSGTEGRRISTPRTDPPTEAPVPQLPAPAPPQEELFEMPKPKGKKKRVMSEKQKAALAKAREKSNEKRKAMALARRKEEALIKAEKKAHLRKRRQKKLEQDALLEEMAETSVMKKEQSMWDEDKLVNLMNRTMDTYFTKRQEEKTRRQQIPVDPAIYANYQPAQPPQRSIQRPRQPAAPRKPRNPYSQLFGLTPEDEDLFNL